MIAPVPPLPARFDIPASTAVEIAVLVQALPLAAGAKLIEQYARTVAAAAKLDAIAETGDRVMAVIEAHGFANAQA